MNDATPGQTLYRLIEEIAVAPEEPWMSLQDFEQRHWDQVAVAFLSACAGTPRKGHTGIWIDLADEKLGDLRALWEGHPVIKADEDMVVATIRNWVREQHEAMARRAEEAEWEEDR